MQISDLIQPANVHADLAASSKLQVLQMLTKKASAALGLSEGFVLEPILTREKLGSTGIAIPHTRLAGLGKPFGMLARLKRPIDFEAIDEVPVDMVFLLLVPDQGSNDHLNALACVARRLRSPDVLARMRAAPDAAQLHAALVSDGGGA